MLGYEINHSNDAIATGHTHIHLYAIGGTLVNRHQIVGFVHRIGDHLGRNELILAEKLMFLTLYHRSVVGCLRIKTTQLVDLSFQIEVTQGQHNFL